MFTKFKNYGGPQNFPMAAQYPGYPSTWPHPGADIVVQPVMGHADSPIVIPDTESSQPQQIPTLSRSSYAAQPPQWPGDHVPHPMGPRFPPFPRGMPPYHYGVQPGMVRPPVGFPGAFPPFPRPTGPPPPWASRGSATSSASVPPPEECYPDVTDEMIEVCRIS